MAESATANFGVNSREARVAWDIVEEQAASTGDKEEYKPTLDLSCATKQECKDFGRKVILL